MFIRFTSTSMLIGILAVGLAAGCSKDSGKSPCTTNCGSSGGSGNAGGTGNAGGSGTAGGTGNAGGTGTSTDGGAGCSESCDGGTVVDTGSLPRLVAYVNVMCGFGIGANGTECSASPDPTVNQVKQWEDSGQSPITHYVISFLSFANGKIQSDPGEIWASGGGSTTDFTLAPGLQAAMQSAQAKGKKVMLSLGGEVGSTSFTGWWQANGVAGMQAQLQAVAATFKQQNNVNVDGFDVDIELGSVYAYGSDKYNSTRDLINAIPDNFLAAFVPQIGNGLCAAPVVGDPLTPPDVLGGQCQQPVNGDDSSWILARLDKDCKKADGTPKLDYWGIQYYNAGQAACCGGGVDDASQATSAFQSYKNLANGWPASGDTTQASNPWNQWAYYPGPWAEFDGFGADRLVLGKPGCQGCAGSDYLDLAGMQSLIGQFDHKLTKTMGGILFWDLGRLFGNTGPMCVSGSCQPSWGGDSVLANLQTLKMQMDALHTQ
jgi:hypothetical protein